MGFSYPKLYEGKQWYVGFQVYDPATGKLRRKKYMLNSIKKISERRHRAAEIIEALMPLLRSGWTPWSPYSSNKYYVLLSDALDKYQTVIDRFDKIKTRHDYSSRMKVLREYISGLPVPPKYAYQYDQTFISGFLDWIYTERECSPRTRNNYRVWCSALASFFLERRYISENPVENIKALPETAKKRQPLTPEMLRKLSDHLSNKDPYFLLACRMEYYTFIRPNELTSVRINDISVAEQSVYISDQASKNRRDGKVGLNDEIIKLMIDLNIFSYPGHYFLFGPKFRPSDRQCENQLFRRRWQTIRKELRWGDEYHFYSLKDSGIRDLANSEGIVIARDQARHADISTTNRYLKGRDLPVHDETKHFTGHL